MEELKKTASFIDLSGLTVQRGVNAKQEQFDRLKLLTVQSTINGVFEESLLCYIAIV